MNKPNRTRQAQAVKTNAPTHSMSLQDFDELAASQAVQVEHQTVPGFLRRIPHKWHLNEITRFGSEMGRAADAMQLVYMTAVDRSLGVLRVFPLPLLERVYTLMQPQFGWPLLEQLPALEEGRVHREELRRVEGTRKHLEDASQHAPSPEVQSALQIALTWLEGEAQRLRGDTPPSPQPLRSI